MCSTSRGGLNASTTVGHCTRRTAELDTYLSDANSPAELAKKGTGPHGRRRCPFAGTPLCCLIGGTAVHVEGNGRGLTVACRPTARHGRGGCDRDWDSDPVPRRGWAGDTRPIRQCLSAGVRSVATAGTVVLLHPSFFSSSFNRDRRGDVSRITVRYVLVLRLPWCLVFCAKSPSA